MEDFEKEKKTLVLKEKYLFDKKNLTDSGYPCKNVEIFFHICFVTEHSKRFFYFEKKKTF